VTQDLFGYLNKEGLELSQSPIKADQLGGLIALIADNTISGKIAKDVFAKMIATGDARRRHRRTRRPETGHGYGRDRKGHRRSHRRQPEARSARRRPRKAENARLARRPDHESQQAAR
jgi:hypothetical protein